MLPSTSASNLLQSGDEVILRNKKRCRVLFSYQPVHDDELELKVSTRKKIVIGCNNLWNVISTKVKGALFFMTKACNNTMKIVSISLQTLKLASLP